MKSPHTSNHTSIEVTTHLQSHISTEVTITTWMKEEEKEKKNHSFISRLWNWKLQAKAAAMVYLQLQESTKPFIHQQLHTASTTQPPYHQHLQFTTFTQSLACPPPLPPNTHTQQPTGKADRVEEIIHSLRHGPQVERLLVGLETVVEIEHLQVAPGKCILDLQFISWATSFVLSCMCQAMTHVCSTVTHSSFTNSQQHSHSLHKQPTTFSLHKQPATFTQSPQAASNIHTVSTSCQQHSHSLHKQPAAFTQPPQAASNIHTVSTSSQQHSCSLHKQPATFTQPPKSHTHLLP